MGTQHLTAVVSSPPLQALPVKDLPGVGWSTEQKLECKGITTVADVLVRVLRCARWAVAWLVDDAFAAGGVKGGGCLLTGLLAKGPVGKWQLTKSVTCPCQCAGRVQGVLAS